MSTFYPPENCIADWPALSLKAWQNMVSELPPYTQPMNGTQGWQIQQLPEAAKLLGLSDDSWVRQYEQHQAQLTRQARKQGEAQNGVFYTPGWITAYLCKRTLGAFLVAQFQQIEVAVSEQDWPSVQQIISRVSALKIIDPACGTGIFLLEALRLLSDFYAQVRQLFPIQMDARFAFENQLFGVDLDPVSVAITEFRLAQWLDPHSQGQSVFQSYQTTHFLTADTLQDTPFSALRWDFILGNPPYISEVRGQSKRFQALQNAEYYQAKMDLCDAFTLWAMDHLSDQGQLAYVLPEYWMHRTNSATLRDRLWTEGKVQELWTFGAQTLFKEAPGHHTALLIWQKDLAIKPATDLQTIQWGQGEHALRAGQVQSAILQRQSVTGKFSLGLAVEMNLLRRLSIFPSLLKPSEIQQGMVLPQGRLKKSDWLKLPAALQSKFLVDSGIFLLTDAEITNLKLNPQEVSLLKPYYGPTGFLPYQGFAQKKADYQLIYGDLEARRQIEENPAQFPQLKAHLDAFEPILTSAFKPYGLHRSRQKHWFENATKILSPRQVMKPAFAVVQEVAYVSEGFYVLTTTHNPALLTAILNSRLAWFWFYHQKRKGYRLQIDKDVLIHFPCPELIDSDTEDQLIALSKQLAEQHQLEVEMSNLAKRVDQLVYGLYGLSKEEIQSIQSAWQTIMRAPQ